MSARFQEGERVYVTVRELYAYVVESRLWLGVWRYVLRAANGERLDVLEDVLETAPMKGQRALHLAVDNTP